MFGLLLVAAGLLASGASAQSVATAQCTSCVSTPSPLLGLGYNSWCDNRPSGLFAPTSQCAVPLLDSSCNSSIDGFTWRRELIDCQPPRAAYSDAFARNYLVPGVAVSFAFNLSEAADCLPNVGGITTLENYTILAQVTAPCGSILVNLLASSIYQNVTCRAFVAYENSSNTLLIAYSGSIGSIILLEQFLQFNAYVVRGTVPGVPGTIVQFYGAALNVTFLTTSLLTAVQDKIPSTAQIYVVGYSLGGALASSTAAYISANFPNTGNKITLYTIGEPRFADATFSLYLYQTIPNYYRIQRTNDPVPNLPSQPTPISLTGPSTYWHAPTHIRYTDAAMADASSVVVCPRADEPSCYVGGDVPTLLNVATHVEYFGQNLANTCGFPSSGLLPSLAPKIIEQKKE